MIWEAWFLLGVLAMVLALLIYGRGGPDVIILGGVSLLVIVDQVASIIVPGRPLMILSTKDAVAGMSNQGMLTVAVMYVVVCGLTETGAVAWIGEKLLGRPRSVFGAQLRMLLPTTLLSAFMNNTPLVAMFIPVVRDWCKKSQIAMPRSWAVPSHWSAPAQTSS